MLENPENQIRIVKPSLFSWKECLWFLDRGYDDCLFTIKDATITKTIVIDNEALLISIHEEFQELVVRCLNCTPTSLQFAEVQEYVEDWFDLNRDISPFYKLLEQYKPLAFMPKAYEGLRLIGIPDLFETLCWCIIGQQINLQFAYTLKRRLVEHFGEAIIYNNEKFYLFPKPKILAYLTIEQLKDMQFSRQKAEYIINLAQLFSSGKIGKTKLKDAGGYHEMINYLCKIHGIGIWTANYALMKTLRIMDSITYGDSGLNKALNMLLNFNKKPSKEEIDRFFNNFEGWKAYLVFYLWRTLSAPDFKRTVE